MRCKHHSAHPTHVPLSCLRSPLLSLLLLLPTTCSCHQHQEAWSQMQQVVAWFSSSILPLNPGARLAFPACLPKEQRADVHTYVLPQPASLAAPSCCFIGSPLKRTHACIMRPYCCCCACFCVCIWVLWGECTRAICFCIVSASSAQRPAGRHAA